MIKRFLVAIAAITTLQVATPLAAQACACGGFVGDHKVNVEQETAVVELSGAQETITMQFATNSAATRAAWVMPVPAKADVTLGDAKIFGELEVLTRPEYRKSESEGDMNGAAAPGGGAGVTVLEQTKIGPYEVAQLAGEDPAAVADWLKQNNFTLPQTLGDGLRPYLAEGWSIAAVKLSAQDGGHLTGLLPPLRLSFATTTPVYPMRLSGLASTPQALRLYVLADHRMEATSPSPDGRLTLYFAGRDEARKKFVTRYDGSWPDPSSIAADIRLTKSASDETFRTVIGGDSSSGTGAEAIAVSDNDWLGIVWIIVGAAIAGVIILVLVAGLKHR